MAKANRRGFLGMIPMAAAAASVPAVAVAQVHPPAQPHRILKVESDNMIPLLFPNVHTIMVEPVSGYEGRGIYLLDTGGAEVPYHCARGIGRPGIHVLSENPRYGDHWISEAEFNRMLRGQVVSATRRFN